MNNKQNKYIVIHYVGSVSSAKNNVDYFYNADRGASANYFVDETSIWQCVEDKDKAWHCGGGLQGSGGHSFYKICTNSNSIGIEMCCKKDSNGNWYFEDATVKNTVDLTKYLMSKHNIPITRVIRHYDVTGKICPSPYISEQAWSNFKNMLTNNTQPETKQEEEDIVTQEQFNQMMNVWIAESANKQPGDWSAEARHWAENNGLIKGDEQGRLMYKKDITREEMITVLYRIFNGDDSKASNWSAEARSWAETEGLVQGAGNNKGWAEYLTKEQFITILYRFKELIK